jgi:hypothetical protein
MQQAEVADFSMPLSPSRRFIGDLLAASSKVPLVPIMRRMSLEPLVQARQMLRVRPSWCAIMTKAFAFVAARRAELRRSYLSWPKPRLYQHASSVAAVAVERRLAAEDAVFFAQLRNPEARSLADLHAYLTRCKEAPLETIGSFRRVFHLARWPRPIRRLVLWAFLNTMGKSRARYLGTFGVTTTAGLGATLVSVASPMTTTLSYGPFDATGGIEVRLLFDHRVFDGAAAARALADLEETLLGAICSEVADLREPVRKSA